MTLFYRLTTDGRRIDVPLEETFAGASPSPCWLLGGGPSLAKLPVAEIAASPVPKLAINLAGTRLMRPTFWTSYDPSARFHRSIYLDPGIMKLVHRRRSMDLVPETTVKVCDCPNTYFFDRDGSRGFADLLAPQPKGIVDWADSMVQGIEILYRLGFRVIYLAGCEMFARPSREQLRRAAEHGVRYRPRQLLTDFLGDCERAGLSAEELDRLEPAPLYHFDEYKPFRSTVQTDFHYFRVTQYLRLSRRSMSIAGLQLVSVTPHSRLNDHFPYLPARRVLRSLRQTIGDPEREPVRGLYHQRGPRNIRPLGPMRDFRPHNWPPDGPPQAAPVGANGRLNEKPAERAFLVEAEGPAAVQPGPGGNGQARARRLLEKLERMPNDCPDLPEVG